jgi:hypothetical protein
LTLNHTFYPQILINTNKKSSLLFQQAAFPKTLINCLWQITARLLGYFPAGHHQLTLFLRLICLITTTLNHFNSDLSRTIAVSPTFLPVRPTIISSFALFENKISCPVDRDSHLPYYTLAVVFNKILLPGRYELT